MKRYICKLVLDLWVAKKLSSNLSEFWVRDPWSTKTKKDEQKHIPKGGIEVSRKSLWSMK